MSSLHTSRRWAHSNYCQAWQYVVVPSSCSGKVALCHESSQALVHTNRLCSHWGQELIGI